MTQRSAVAPAVDVYWLPYCTTCQKAVAHLQERGASIRGYRNLKEAPLSEDEVRALAAKVGGVGRLFSKRAMKYRQMGLHERDLSDDDLVRLHWRSARVEKLFSKRAMKYRQMGLHEREVPEDEMVKLMSEEYTFVTRPVIVRGDRATAGFSAKRVDELMEC